MRSDDNDTRSSCGRIYKYVHCWLYKSKHLIILPHLHLFFSDKMTSFGSLWPVVAGPSARRWLAQFLLLFYFIIHTCTYSPSQCTDTYYLLYSTAGLRVKEGGGGKATLLEFPCFSFMFLVSTSLTSSFLGVLILTSSTSTSLLLMVAVGGVICEW